MKSDLKNICICFCKGLIVLLPFLFVWAYAYLFPMNYIGSEYVGFLWGRDYVRKPEADADVLLLGDSVAFASLIPAELSEDTLSLALPGVSALEAYHMLREYLEYHDAPQTVYISIYDDHMAEDINFIEMTLYAHRFPLRDEIEMIRVYGRQYGASMTRVDAALTLFQYHFAFPTKYMPALTTAHFFGRRADNMSTYDAYTANQGRSAGYEGVLEDTTEYTHNTYSVDPTVDESMRKLLDLCVENDIQPRIFLPPKAPTISYNQDYLDQINGYYDSLMADYPSLTCDIHPDLGLEIEDYADYAHLNGSGAKKVTAYIREKYAGDFR